MSRDALTLLEARRLALTAQGFDRFRPARVGDRHLAELINRLGLLQLDFVNVLTPSHYLVAFSRLGPYERARLDRVVYGRRAFTEAWAHEASIVPMATWPLLRYRRETHIARPWGFDEIMASHHEYVETAMAEITRRGPLGPADLPDPLHTGRRLPESWYGSVPRAVLEACFGRGQVAVTMRRENFSRVFDLAERVIPEEHVGRVVERHEAQRELLLIAARACGIGTAADLADYFRMKVGEARPRLAELVEAGRVHEAGVEGWREPAYRHPDANAAKPINARALLSPFDPVIWYRPRTLRLFGFDYRFEIFIPESKRKWGSYVLPFLMGDRLVARVDVKIDRRAKRLLVPGAWLEDEAGTAAWVEEGAGPSAAWVKDGAGTSAVGAPDGVADALAAELRSLASWLGADTVRVGRRGNLARALAAAAARK